MWYVNGERYNFRSIITMPDGTVRLYALDDMVQCKSMGFVDPAIAKCRLDPAVAPLFFLYCMGVSPPSACSSTLPSGGTYVKGKSTT